MGWTRHVQDLSYFARHGYLTFGAIVNCNQPGILAHFPSIPPPEWFCTSYSSDLEASYSASDRLRHRTAYLSQSFLFAEACDDPYHDLVFIDDVRFSLLGTFRSDPARSTTPAYLFVPPIPVEVVDNVYCIRYPLPDTLFFWCSDPDGQNVICEEHWEAYGISQLEIFTWIGSLWWDRHETVRDHLRKKSCALDGRQYAREHGYPELAYGDPHNPRTAVVEEPDTPEQIDSSPEQLKHQGDPNVINSSPIDQPSSEAPEAQCFEAAQIKTCAGIVPYDPI
ncbi:hypothetical protein PM082_022830 [Marasmius tenuissimus]|nr:hypothetical protein PM082_022830 [Marasmius tenuissimus]